jgi:outer membrane receptor protein involved in Fe transport
MSRLRSQNQSSFTRSAPRLSPLSACLAAALGVPLGAAAQQAPTASTSVETVTVTATKRTEKLQDVPLSVKAITGDELERRGVSSLEEALPGEPSVVFSKAGTPLTRSIAIRGVADGAAVGLTQSTVALYIDDIPTSVVQGNGNIDLGLFDIDNVLVIRGPRSTLYGSASLGGTIKITTRNPSLKEMESYARLGLSKTKGAGDWNNEAVASVSVPVVKDVAAIGLTVYRTEQAGIVDAGALGNDVDKIVTSGARIGLYARPTPELSVSGRIYLQDLDQDTTSAYNFGTNLQSTSKAVLEPQSDKLRAANLAINYKMPGFDIVSATSYMDKKARYVTDSTSFLSAFNGAFGLPPDTQWVTLGTFDSRVAAQELRLVSRAADVGITWSAGLFWSNEKTKGVAATNVPILGNAFGADVVFDRTQTALFGELGYKLANGFAVNAGLRRTSYESDDGVNLIQFGVTTPNPALIKESPMTPHLSVSWSDARSTYYVQGSKGFRLGKTNYPLAIPPGVDFQVPLFASSDSLWTYEAGAKLSLADNRVNVNAAVYQTKWKNPQLTLTSPPAVGGFTYVDSLGRLNPGASIDVKGFELEVVARPTAALRLAAGLGYVDSTISRDVVGLDATGGSTPGGTRSAGIPKVTGNASVRYDFELAGMPSNVGFNLQHVGEYESGYTPSTRRTLGGYTAMDMRFGVDIGNLTLTAYVNNVTDERPLVTSTPFGAAELVTTMRPRTVGLVGVYRF